LSSCSTFAEEEAVASLDDEEEDAAAARSARNFASMAAKFACVSSEDDALTITEFVRPLRATTTPTRDDDAVARFPIRRRLFCFCAPVLENDFDDDVFFAATTVAALWGVVLATEKRDMFCSDSAFTCVRVRARVVVFFVGWSFHRKSFKCLLSDIFSLLQRRTRGHVFRFRV
jgi:hypothetical protein